jgi:predicted TIM-barrel fold metal-dependent hydrolase
MVSKPVHICFFATSGIVWDRSGFVESLTSACAAIGYAKLREAFGPQRSMFESNLPVDKGTCSYQVLWNTFKRIAAGYSPDEKTALFSGTAAKAYRLTL